MTEIDHQTFLTALPDDKQLKLLILNNDEDNVSTDAESSNDFDYMSVLNDESEEIINRKATQEIPSLLIQTIENDGPQDNISHDKPSSPAVGENSEPLFTRSVFDYAAAVCGKLEDPHQNKLNHDINAILGSSDPPAGFGFLQPQIYYLTQKRPIPMEPLRVWRGYNGHVYFLPIQVQQLEADRAISPTKSRKSTAPIRTISSSAKKLERSRTISTEHRSRKSSTYKTFTSKDRINNDRLFTSGKGYTRTVASANELTNNTRTTFSEGEDNKVEIKEESTEMWRSVVTCIPVPKKPISKRSQHDLEDLRILKQQHVLQDPIGSNRPVLPNIRLRPKSKFLYKGLAYKEVKKIPGIADETDNESSTSSLQRPLVDYGRTQAYLRHEVNAARTKRNIQPPPPTAATAPYTTDQQLTRSQTVLDIRETRKRIVKGTTAAHHPASKRPGRTDNRAVLASEILLPTRGYSTMSNIHISSSVVCTTPPPQYYATGHTTPTISETVDVPPIDNNTNVLSLQTIEQRPSTSKSKSSISAQQTTASEIPILTKYVNRPRSMTRHTPTAELVADAS